MNLRRIPAILAMWFLFWASAAWPQQSQQQQRPQRNAEIRGQIRLPDGRPASLGIGVYLEYTSGSMVGQTQTDRLGKFEFLQVPPAVYIIRVRLTGYREIAEQLDLRVMPMAHVNLELHPDPKYHDPLSAPPPAGVVSAFDTNVPEGARKDLESGKDLLAQGKNLGKSIQLFKKAIAAYPKYSEAYLLMGLAYRSQNQLSDASTALNKAIEINANFAPAYMALGELQSEQKDYAGSEKSLLKAVELSPDSAEAHLELARTYWATGKWQEADPHAVKVVQLKPENVGAHVLLGNILLRKRDPQGALKEFNEALRLDPKGPLSDNIKQVVKKIEDALQKK